MLFPSFKSVLIEYAELGKGKTGVGFVVLKPRFLPNSAIAKMDDVIFKVEGKSVKELREYIRKNRTKILTDILLAMAKEVNKI